MLMMGSLLPFCNNQFYDHILKQLVANFSSAYAHTCLVLEFERRLSSGMHIVQSICKLHRTNCLSAPLHSGIFLQFLQIWCFRRWTGILPCTVTPGSSARCHHPRKCRVFSKPILTSQKDLASFHLSPSAILY